MPLIVRFRYCYSNQVLPVSSWYCTVFQTFSDFSWSVRRVFNWFLIVIVYQYLAILVTKRFSPYFFSNPCSFTASCCDFFLILQHFFENLLPWFYLVFIIALCMVDVLSLSARCVCFSLTLIIVKQSYFNIHTAENEDNSRSLVLSSCTAWLSQYSHSFTHYQQPERPVWSIPRSLEGYEIMQYLWWAGEEQAAGGLKTSCDGFNCCCRPTVKSTSIGGRLFAVES